MAHAVFIQNPESVYKDDPGRAYHFPRRYLGVVRETVGDWVVIYEGRQGAFGYRAIQRVQEVIADPELRDHYFALLDQGSEWDFERIVPRADPSGLAYENSLRGPDGRPTSGGANVSAVRRLSEAEFAAIFSFGMQHLTGPETLPRQAEDTERPGFEESVNAFAHAPLAAVRRELLVSRKARDESFARQVKAAYGARCAISGLELRNGGGRPEVEAAHIRPVQHDGPDIVRNGLALSGTLHWMFDRGLISVASDYSILISHNKVDSETASRLITPDRKLRVPADPRLRPHPEYLRYHRENIFGQVA